MTPERAIYLADRAKEVLENEAFLDAFEQIHTEILNKWRASPVRDTDGREKLWQMQSFLTELKAILTTTMQTGKLKAADLAHKKSTLQKLREFALLNGDE